jgi:RNA-binding protein YhbY
MPRRKFHRHRILNLAVGKNTMEKSITKPIDRTLNTRALDKIDADSKHAHPE